MSTRLAPPMVAILSLLLLVSVCSSHISSGEYQIISSSSDPCPREPCLTLPQFVDKSHVYLTDNTTLIFQPGNHTLNSVLFVSNISTLSMLTSSLSDSVIICNGLGRFEFSSIRFIHMSNLTFVGCSGNRVDYVPLFSTEDLSFIGEENAPGTALEFVHTTANLHRCTFISNSGKKHSVLIHNTVNVMLAGGAIVSTSSNVNITDNWFEGNHAQAGGAIFSQLLSNVTIRNSTFTGNFVNKTQTVESAGGVLYATEGGTVTFHDSHFIKNSAINNFRYAHCDHVTEYIFGGVVSVERFVTVNINHSQFINNTVQDNECGRGGALSAVVAKVTIMYSQFIGNSARRGGAVFINGGHFNVITASFHHNSASAHGGALFAFSGNFIVITNDTSASKDVKVKYTSSFNVNNSSFHHNSAFINGGALHLERGPANNINFFHHYSDFAEGGRLSKDGGKFCITNSSFHHNSAHEDGGVLSLTCKVYECNVFVTKSFLDYNSANGNGGVFNIRLQVGKKINISIIETTFSGNTAKKDGGVFYAESDTTNTELSVTYTVIECKFHNNRAGGDGGVTVSQGALLLDHHSNYSNNSAEYDGGIVSLQSGIFITKESTFIHNSAGHDGGIVSLQSGNFTTQGSTFISNSAGHDGGVIESYKSSLEIADVQCNGNSAMHDGGILNAFQSTSYISGSLFESNYASNDGGVITAYQGVLNVFEDTTFNYNIAGNGGGVIHAYEVDTLIIAGNMYNGNKAKNRGGVWFVYQGSMKISQSIVSNNQATDTGGALYSSQGHITIQNSSSIGNTAKEGGVLCFHQASVSISHSSFSQNSVDYNGGAVYSSASNLTLLGSVFLNNSANSKGGAIYSSQSHINSSNRLDVSSNTANLGVIYLQESTAHISGQTVVSQNAGSFMMLASKITLAGTTHFTGNSEPVRSQDSKVNMHEGGALTASKSEIFFNGICTLTDNNAENGGAMHATDHNKVYVNGEVTVAYNRANRTGGGIYLDLSEVKCLDNSSLNISSNSATEKGGGVHAIGSSINVFGNSIYNNDSANDDSMQNEYTGSLLHFSNNEAEKGGGLCLETSSRLYILKFRPQFKPFSIVTFSGNLATNGGAVYVSDDSNVDSCNPSFPSRYEAKECVFQVLALYSSFASGKGNSSIKNIYFSDNHAPSGSSLYGGLIDRCKLHSSSELQDVTLLSPKHWHNSPKDKIKNGITYMTHISNINISVISSEPVQLCFCKDSVHDCGYQPDPIKVIKGKTFVVEVVAINQVGHPVSARIQSNLRRTTGGFESNQKVQNTSETCTGLKFNLFSPYDKDELIMSAEGPCELQQKLSIHFTACDSCPIGFKKHTDEDTTCQCVCDSRLEPYITKCNASTELLERKGDFWITYINSSDNATSGYIIYPHCPLNYCKPPTTKVEINLNIPGGADIQCADGHSGMLCGSCQSNLSLSLGSSKCIPCSTNWIKIAIIIAATIIAGICLVALLLVLNMTVAVGTVNGIILYANIVASSGSTFFPFSTPNYITIFVSWLNLEIGFDTCFFEGMDAYWKTLLHLAFPLYVILLVVMVIMISEHSPKFARLVARRNPVATLATLILLSYTKFLNTIVASLSFATLDYPDGSRQRVWLADATVDYLKGKHIVLFALALLILLVSVVYTGLLFSWQWLLLYQDKIRIVKLLTKSQKLCHFIEPYHAPYTFEQRYWTGLLLFVRVILYVIIAVNLTSNPQVSLVSTAILIGFILLLKAVLEKKIYKEKIVDIMEMFMYFNIVTFSIVTLITGNTEQQTIVAYISVLFTQACLLLVILFHIYRYSGFCFAVKKIKSFIVRINHDRSTNRHVAILPNEEDDRPLITHTVVEIPSSRRLHLESAQQTDSAILVLESPIVDGDSKKPINEEN